MTNAVQIKYAGSDQAQPGLLCNFLYVYYLTQLSSGDIKLFVGMIPKTATVEELLPIFGPFGEIEELSILKGPEGQSKGKFF